MKTSVVRTAAVLLVLVITAAACGARVTDEQVRALRARTTEGQPLAAGNEPGPSSATGPNPVGTAGDSRPGKDSASGGATAGPVDGAAR